MQHHSNLDALLHPDQAFERPMDIVNDSDLTIAEKRAILASWASDACAVEAMSELGRPTATCVVKFDDIIDALRALDRQAKFQTVPHYRRVLAERTQGVFNRSQRPKTDGLANLS